MNTILIVDDEISLLKMMKQALSRKGFIVETAASGKEALQKFESDIYDLVITDICMPDIDGLNILGYIRNSDRSRTPIIGISGTPWRLSGNGFDSVLSKPFSIKTLLNLTDRLVGGCLEKKRPAVNID